MNVAIVIDIFHDKGNGTSMSARHLVENLVERGIGVKVLCDNAGQQNENDAGSGVRYVSHTTSSYLSKSHRAATRMACISERRANQRGVEGHQFGAYIHAVCFGNALRAYSARVGHTGAWVLSRVCRKHNFQRKNEIRAGSNARNVSTAQSVSL